MATWGEQKNAEIRGKLTYTGQDLTGITLTKTELIDLRNLFTQDMAQNLSELLEVRKLGKFFAEYMTYLPEDDWAQTIYELRKATHPPNEQGIRDTMKKLQESWKEAYFGLLDNSWAWAEYLVIALENVEEVPGEQPEVTVAREFDWDTWMIPPDVPDDLARLSDEMLNPVFLDFVKEWGRVVNEGGEWLPKLLNKQSKFADIDDATTNESLRDRQKEKYTADINKQYAAAKGGKSVNYWISDAKGRASILRYTPVEADYEGPEDVWFEFSEVERKTIDDNNHDTLKDALKSQDNVFEFYQLNDILVLWTKGGRTELSYIIQKFGARGIIKVSHPAVGAGRIRIWGGHNFNMAVAALQRTGTKKDIVPGTGTSPTPDDD